MSKELTLEDIQNSYKRIKPHIKRTLNDYSFNISESLGINLYLKLEMLQRCKTFKFRGDSVKQVIHSMTLIKNAWKI